MKAMSIAMALVFSLASASALACPKGTHLVGGTGPHHKGGKCEAAAGAKTADVTQETKADAKAAKKEAKKEAKAKKKAEAGK